MDARDIRARLGHPVIDSDAHWLEFGPLVKERLRQIGGDKAAAGFTGVSEIVPVQDMGPDERARRRVGHPGFWMLPMKNTRDRATAMLPALLAERLDELGLDYCVLYPTGGGQTARCPDPEIRRAACRAFNTFSAEYFADHAERLTPVAVIPMHTPDEAVAELEHVRTKLGLKACLLNGMIPRDVAAALDGDPEANKLGSVWYDVFGIDSAYDYDQVWQACIELGVSPTFHAGGRGYALRRSPTNFTYNHIGHFASTAEAICKALFLGGVTRRFPALRVAFLEGGTAWACQLYADLIEHWEKRCRGALEWNDPANLDRSLLVELAGRYGPPGMAELLAEGDNVFDAGLNPAASTRDAGQAELDDYAPCAIAADEDIRDLFVPNFYFGCEADDRMNASAFNTAANPFGAQLNALFSSDIGHFDVIHMNRVLPHAWELVVDGVMSEEQFRDFTFTNPARFWTANNPGFFAGTAVEADVAALRGVGAR
ncbi:MAG: amidohydrolase family protein [Acidimicrobiales bacterium]